MKKHTAPVSSFRKKALLTMSIIVIPLFIVIVLFVFFTIQNQHFAVRSLRTTKLAAYQSQFDGAVQTADAFLRNTVAGNNDFLCIVYAKTRTEVYVASESVAKTLFPLLKADPILGGFYTYSRKFDYYRPINAESYPRSDAALIQEAIQRAAEQRDNLYRWQPVKLSDRTVLLSTAVFRNTAIAAVVDPSKQAFSGLNADEHIFCISKAGHVYDDALPFQHIKAAPNTNIMSITDDAGIRYESVFVPLGSIDGYMVYAAPRLSFVSHLSIAQVLLLVIMLFLLASIPVYWLTFRRVLLEPMHDLTGTMQEIQSGNTMIHVPLRSNIQEVNEIAGTVNIMLDTLRQQKIDFYEQKLRTNSTMQSADTRKLSKRNANR